MHGLAKLPGCPEAGYVKHAGIIFHISVQLVRWVARLHSMSRKEREQIFQSYFPLKFEHTEFLGNAAGGSEFLALKHMSRILVHYSNPVCGFSMMELVGLCAV